MTALKTTPLYPLHLQHDAKMVSFAGYDMPVQYPLGIMQEHLHTRENAGLFDVSHMGQALLRGDNVVAELQKLVPADLEALPLMNSVYSLFTNDSGGILDDLIITKWADDTLFVVINAACKEQDIAHLKAHLVDVEIQELESQALMAVQGPKARDVVSALCPAASELVFMSGTHTTIDGKPCFITCSGYTGEDGYEISCASEDANAIAQLLLANPVLKPIGLGARDSLRLEAGLCLYGHDLSLDTNPIEAGLIWAIAKSRRESGGFAGSDTILQQIKEGAQRKRVGLEIEGRAPVREGAEIVNANGDAVGVVCSGGFSPTLKKPIAMAYVATEYAAVGTALQAKVRNKLVDISICKMPFVAQRYVRSV